MANALQTLFTEIADSIRGGLPNEGKMSPNDFPEKIDEIVANGGTGGGGSSGGGGGGVSVPSSDINFYDYDGTRVAAWTLDELAAATALPDNPSHDGLIAQGWNWSLADLQAVNRIMDVGQSYITDDGKTRLYIEIESKLNTVVTLNFSQTVANGVTIDWGDGSATKTLAGTGNVNTSHTYERYGSYVVTLDVADGCEMGLSNGRSTFTGGYYEVNMLRKAEIGKNVSLASGGFYDNRRLETITIPKSVTSFSDNTFHHCESLKCLVFPDGLTSINKLQYAGVRAFCMPNGVTAIADYAFRFCSKIKRITFHDGITTFGGEGAFDGCNDVLAISLPETLTKIPNDTFKNCYCIDSFTIPSAVTSISGARFHTSVNWKEMHFKPTTPPTAGYGVFMEFLPPTDCVFYVPKGSLSAYTSAKNYPSASTYTYIEE